MEFIQQFINGLNLGSIYALMALGYTMVYGIAKMLNFAHGDIIMVGAYTISVGATMFGLSPIASVLLSMVVCTILGVVIEKIAYKPLRLASPLTVLITAIGVSYFLQSTALLIFGSEQRRVASVITVKGFNLGPIELTGESVVTLGATTLIMIGLALFINFTKTGKAMLAVSEDRGAAELMGININNICCRFNACCSCRCIVCIFIWICWSIYRCFTRYKSLRCCCIRWYRKYTRSNAWWHFTWYY